MWRLLNNILPTTTNLEYRGIAVDKVCCICGFLGETWPHIFFHCISSRAVWSEFGNGLDLLIHECDNADTFWYQFLSCAREKGWLSMVCNILWFLWSNRNHCFHESTCLIPRVLLQKADRWCLELPEDVNNVSTVVTHQCWQPPPLNVLKINVDASFHQQQLLAKLGVVVRDSGGRIIFSATQTKLNITSALLGELHAMLLGLDLAHQWNFSDVILESDCLFAVSEIQKHDDSMMLQGCLIADIRDLLATFLTSSVLFVKRAVNTLAHDVATNAPISTSIITWPGGLPPQLLTFD
ncbi:hypothetical protein REPUB_Repub20aG0048600 [Reevesia pubescens]